jgi:NAD(P)-dependent dehydrogenase (short-subunit alcohol dehydrogenase family)
MTQRTAVVIGVGAEIGLGAALCRRFASAGMRVLVAGRTPAKLERVASSISAAAGSAEADSGESGASAAFSSGVRRHGGSVYHRLTGRVVIQWNVCATAP